MEVRWCMRGEGKTMNVRPEVAKPKAKPSAFEAGVTGYKYGFSAVKLAEHPLPDFPRRVTCGPELFKLLLFALGVHALPETGVTMGLKLAFAGKVRQRFALQNAIISSEVFANTPVEHEEAAIHKARFLIGLFTEGSNGAFPD